MESKRISRPFAVTTYTHERGWHVRGFARLSDARSFCARESARLRTGLQLARINPDLSTDFYVLDSKPERWVHA